MGGNKAISELHKHTYNEDGTNKEDIRYSSFNDDRKSYAIVDDDWHTYGMLWTEDAFVMYVDGVEIQRYDLNKEYEKTLGGLVTDPFALGMEGFKTQPLCIILNNYLFTQTYADTEAGNWAKDKVVADDFTESVYDIDYVRLYQDETGILYKK